MLNTMLRHSKNFRYPTSHQTPVAWLILCNLQTRAIAFLVKRLYVTTPYMEMAPI